jgi:hypothetical protein
MNPNIIIFISTTLFCMISCQGQIEKHGVKAIAIKEFYKDYVELMNSFGKHDIKILEVEESTELDYTFDNLLKKTKIFVYAFRKVEPNYKLILYRNKTGFGFFDESYYMEDDIVSQKLINKVNDFLKYEINIYKDSLNQLLEFLLYTKYRKHDAINILNSWEQIVHDEENVIPSHIKEIVKPLKILKKNNDKLSIYFYCWDKFTTILYEGVFSYNYTDRIANIKFNKLEKVGIPSISI